MWQLTADLKEEASRLGFPLAGAVLAAVPGRLSALHAWLESGFAGQMQYIESRKLAYQHPEHVLEGCRSLLMLGMPYLTEAERKQVPDSVRGEARVARYAQGPADYHDVIHERLRKLRLWLLDRYPNARVRGVVDTAPLLEREFAEMAGLGWVGKNTLLLNRDLGSYFFLAALLTDLELSPDEPLATGHCGTCTACMDHCPTNAFPQPYVLDATRCISYLTIEHRTAIAEDLAPALGDWMFGCDVCQEVCPWNRKSATGGEEVFEVADGLQSVDVLEVLAMDDDAFHWRFRKTPLWRSKRRGILRNAILVAANQGLREAVPLIETLCADAEPLVRDAAAWAFKKLML